jgi:hypothetical protein
MDELEIVEGLNSNQIKQLIEYTSTDLLVAGNTSDRERFYSAQGYEEWLSMKERIVLALVDRQDNLLGITWFNKKDFPEGELAEDINIEDFPFTSSIRLYGEVRGKGLSYPLYKEAHLRFYQTKLYQNCAKKGIWNVITDGNSASIKLHEKMGYKAVGRQVRTEKLIMVLNND